VLEKPLTIAVAEGHEILRRGEASGRVHAVCFNNRFYPLVQEIHARVRRGDLGEILSVRASVLEDGLLQPTDWNWRLDPSLGGSSVALSTVGCHLLDLVTFVVGDTVTEVCADLRTVHRRRQIGTAGRREVEVDGQEIAHLLLRFRNGCRGVLAASQASAGRRYDYAVEVDGSREALAWRAPDSNELWLGHRDAPNQIILRDPALLTDRARAYMGYGAGFREGFAETFRQLVMHIYGAIAAGGPPPPAEAAYPTFHDGVAALCVHAAALASSLSGRWEDVVYGDA
jgi:predicted dehydrogenase